ncbi:MAG: hypothetical protein J0L84_01475 [Verrucomicrobia bacterium]|nr:hypothetical protein [Verrucomicrobiota bacterium]
MAKMEFDTALAPLLERDTRYARGAYHFVREALSHAQAELRRNGEEAPRHVSSGELLEGIRSYALEQFGPMTCTVFEDWGIRSCDDFGEVVFNMIECQILSKTDADSREDFSRGYDFEDAFRRPFAPENRPDHAASPEASR